MNNNLKDLKKYIYNNIFLIKIILYYVILYYLMHDAAVNFLTFVKNILPHYFKNIEYLDVGAGDINGNLNHLFENCIKNANDVAPNKNITIICKTKDLPFPNKNCSDDIVFTIDKYNI